MSDRLLDRQVSLLRYLTSGGAIFADASGALADHAPAGIDRALLHLEARFSHEKRMGKIGAILPKTFALLRGERSACIAAFVTTCPPRTLASLDNARQFHEFLVTLWHNERRDPPYLADVASCELARAEVRRRRDTDDKAQPASPGFIRRSPGAKILRCTYDVRMIFEDGDTGDREPDKRETLLAIALPAGAEQPFIAELRRDIFDLLTRLDDYTDPASLPDMPGSETLPIELVRHGLLEVAV